MEIPQYLLQNNIKPSYQRIKIFEYLYQNMNHPTADLIYKNLMYEIPTLSKTTVYNTLKLFVDNGVVNLLSIEDNETRYDAEIKPHAHFKCEVCSRIYDVEIVFNQLKLNVKDFDVRETQINLKGKCNQCLTIN